MNPVTLVRILVGAVASVADHDAFSTENPIPKFASGQCEFLITVTGINMTQHDQESFNEKVSSLPAYKGIPNAMWVNNPTWLKTAGDWIQIGFHELLGALTVTEQRFKRKVKAAAKAARQNGCCCWYIHVVAHSQGTMIVRQALSLIDDDTKKHMTFVGLGGETTVGVGDGIAYGVNYLEAQDPVGLKGRTAIRWNDGPNPEVFDDPGAHGLRTGSHDWDNTYLNHLRQTPSLLKGVPRCQ